MRKKIQLAAGLAVSTLLLTSACSSGGGSDAAGGSEDGIVVKAGVYSWTAATVTTAIISEVVAQKPDLGVSEIETTQLDPALAWAGAGRGDIDLLTEVALPNQQELADGASDTMSIVSETYGDADQGWFVPAYTVEEGGPAEGLKSVTDLNDFADVFDSTFYDADPGYITTEQNTKRLEGYGIDFEHVNSSEAAELAQLKKSYDAEEPIVLYLYHPHAVFAQYDMVQLEEPTPYTDGCLTTGDGACAMPAYSANIALSTAMQEDAPAFADFLADFRISIDEMEEMQKSIDVDGTSVEDAATAWITDHQDDVDSWSGE